MSKYNAFISYKHEVEDTKIAKLIQRELEHYRIPDRIQEKTGFKKIERVFRDTDELSLTANLSDTITDALDNTDYLIVICSKKTKESEWVLREINYFLEKHSRDHILTVLIEGEPAEVVPEVLQYEEDTLVEPLSCDFRFARKIAEKIELPRLVSAIIGCSYSELIDRQRAYYIKHLTKVIAIISVVALIFVLQLIYGIYSINKNYKNALINKSEYLAHESQQLLDESEKITAIQLALAGLPSEKNKKQPVTTAAINALTDATGVYEPTSDENFHFDYSYTSKMDISGLSISEDGKYLASINIYETVQVWDTETHEQTFETTLSIEDKYNITFTKNNYLLVWNENAITAYDAQSGEIAYTIKSEDYKINKNIINSEKEDAFYAFFGGAELRKYSSKDGSLLESFPTEFPEDYEVRMFSISPEEKLLAISSLDSNSQPADYIMDLSTLEISELKQSYLYASSYFWNNENSLLISGYKFSNDFSMLYKNNRYLSNTDVTLRCIDVKTAKVKWSNEFTNNEAEAKEGFLNSIDNKSVIHYYGSICTIYNWRTGEITESYDANSPIVYLYYDNADSLSIITNDGYNGSLDEGQVNITKKLNQNISYIVYNNGIYICSEESTRISHYTTSFNNPYWHKLNGQENFDFSYLNYMDENYYVEDGSIEDTRAFFIYNLKDDTYKIVKFDADDIEATYWMEFITIYDSYLYYFALNLPIDEDISDLYLGKMSLETGERTLEPVGQCDSTHSHLFYASDKAFAYYNLDENNNYKINIMDFSNGTSKTFDAPEGSIPASKPVFSSEENLLYYASSGGDYFIDMSTGEATPLSLPEDWAGTYNARFIGDNKILVTDSKRTIILDCEGNTISTITKTGSMPVDAFYYKKGGEEYVLVCYSNSLSVYDATDCKPISEIEIDDYIYNTEWFVSKDNNYIYLNSISENMYALDTESWELAATIPKVFGYQVSTDRFYTLSSDMRHGYFEHFSDKELIKIGNEMLHGEELSEEQKSLYGIDD